MNLKHIPIAALAAILLITNLAHGHSGRRLEIRVVDNQLVAQGYISGDVPVDDGAGITRPYFNAIHSHFSATTSTAAFATLPGFDLLNDDGNADALTGFNLDLELIGSGRWTPPTPIMTPDGPDFGVILLEALDSSQVLEATTQAHATVAQNQTVASTSLGKINLSDSVAGAISDIDFDYILTANPGTTHFALEWKLSSGNPDVMDSGSIYTVLSPTGAHHAALALERSLSTSAVPEPSGMLLLILGSSCAALRRRR